MLDALFPETRQAVLGTFLLRPERRWYLRDLAQHLHVRPSSLQRELASLTEAGILRREPDGNRVYYQAEPSFPLLPELQSLFVKTVGLTDKVRATLLPFLDEAEFAFIYGSVARGERVSQSDVDVMIIGSVRLTDLALPLRELEHALQVPVNVTLYTRDEWIEKLRRGHHFLLTVMRGPKIFLKGTEHELADALGGPTSPDSHDQSTGD